MQRHTISDYMNTYLNYGGYAVRRCVAIKDMEAITSDNQRIDRYLQGNCKELTQKEVDAFFLGEKEFHIDKGLL